MTTRTPSGLPVWLPRLAAIAGCAFFLGHGLSVVLGSERTVMEWLYDDSFYYMITAKHFAEAHISSFDGVTLTSGYHPLWMWTCAAVYALRDRLDLAYVRCCMSLALCLASGMLFAALRHAWMKQRNGMLWALALGATSYSALNNGINAMEWPLVVLVWFLLHNLLAGGVSATETERHRGIRDGLAFLLGVAGSLSRTDFGLIPAAYLGSALLLAGRSERPQPTRRAAIATAGAACGVMTVFWYNLRMTGSLLQGSAEIKRLAATLGNAFNPVPALWQFMRVLLYLPPLDLAGAPKALMLRQALVPVLVLATLAAALVLVRWKRFSQNSSADAFTLVAATLGIASYLVLYAFNTQATYGWYTASVTGFVLLLTARLLASMRLRTAASIVVPLMLMNIAAALFWGGNARAQTGAVLVGKALHIEHPGSTLGAGDAGKPSFYNNGTMINLDGLMNNEAIPYIAAGRIHCYILHRHIEYMADIGTITEPVTDAERAKNGEAPLPWQRYFERVNATSIAGTQGSPAPIFYLKSNFDAIRASGECSSDK